MDSVPDDCGWRDTCSRLTGLVFLFRTFYVVPSEMFNLNLLNPLKILESGSNHESHDKFRLLNFYSVNSSLSFCCNWHCRFMLTWQTFPLCIGFIDALHVDLIVKIEKNLKLKSWPNQLLATFLWAITLAVMCNYFLLPDDTPQCLPGDRISP